MHLSNTKNMKATKHERLQVWIGRPRLRLAALGLLLFTESDAWIQSVPVRHQKVVTTALMSTTKRQPCHHSSRNRPEDIKLCKVPLEDSFRSLKRTAAGAFLAASLVLTPTLPERSNHLYFQPSAHASDEHVTHTASKSSTTVVDEAWNLIDKYYIDRSFNGQDWKQVHNKYRNLVAKQGKSDESGIELKLVTEMVSSLGDKYSRILDPKQYAAIQKFDLIGVGATLMPNDAKQIIVGSPPIAGSAAAQVGLQVGDRVTAINGVSTTDRTAFDIIDQISDNPNAPTVTFSVLKKDSDENDAPVEYQLPREFQQVKNTIRYKITERRDDGTTVGFIKILEFNSLVKAKLEEALQELSAQGANAYVLDLRQNTGGAFQSAVEISSLFVSDSVATYVRDNTEKSLAFRTQTDKLAIRPTDPIVLWIDGFSASASEVLAGSLHDNCRAVLMGDKSFGKGLIQAVYGLQNGAGLVLTVAKYVTPNGNEIQGVGLTPDIEKGVPLPIPGLSADTSKIDFGQVKSRLDPSYCKVPVGTRSLIISHVSYVRKLWSTC